jgi:hypothetical protein
LTFVENIFANKKDLNLICKKNFKYMEFTEKATNLPITIWAFTQKYGLPYYITRRLVSEGAMLTVQSATGRLMLMDIQSNIVQATQAKKLKPGRKSTKK